MSDKISLPPINNKVSNSYLAIQQKRSRGSWWDPKADKHAQIQRVKDMVRHSANESDNDAGNVFIAPAAEAYAFVESEQDIRVEIAPTPPAVPLNRKKASSDTPRTQYMSAKVSGRSVALQTSQYLMMPAETQTDSDKASVDKIQESVENYKKVVSRQNSRLKRLERLSMDIASEDTTDNMQLTYSLLDYFQRHRLDSTLAAFQSELNIKESTTNHIRLKAFIKNLDFINALNYVEYVVSKEMESLRAINQNLIMMTSYEDLIYVLTKYRFIRLCQQKEFLVARTTLEDQIFPIVQNEQRKSGIRGKWFLTDYHLLSALLNPQNLSESNLYGRFNWENELGNFWESVKNLKTKKESSVPLYAHILLLLFWDDCQNIPLLEDLSSDAGKWKLINYEIQKDSSKSVFEIDNGAELNECKKINRSASSDTKPVSSEQYLKKAKSSKNVKSKISASFTNSSYNDEINSFNSSKVMLPLSREPETAEFALSNSCGPTLSQIRVIDVCSGRKDGSFICASAGDDSKSDRCISIWDIRIGSLVKRIDNCSNKAIIILYFHPIYSNLIFSVDMEFDLKLWDWETGELKKCWKKHHSRIIHKIELMPGTAETMVSCSGDQSLKLFDIENENIPQRSIHANEPITSFVFCGSPSDPTQQKIVISLSYSIRIYKLRTLGIIHNISLKELKENKTPISMMQSHPIHDNYVLISSENHLRLFDLLTGTTLRVFATRHIESGTRIEGRFSPFGNFVYCGNCDLRAYSTVPTKKSSDYQYHRPVNGIFIWRVQTGKLEIDDMRAMSNQYDTPAVFVARWATVQSGTTSRKVLLLATIDRQLRIYY